MLASTLIVGCIFLLLLHIGTTMGPSTGTNNEPAPYKGLLFESVITEQYKAMKEKVQAGEAEQFQLDAIGTLKPKKQAMLDQLEGANPPHAKEKMGRFISRLYPDLPTLIRVWKPEPGDVIEVYSDDFVPGHTFMLDTNTTLVHLAVHAHPKKDADGKPVLNNKKEPIVLARTYKVRQHTVKRYVPSMVYRVDNDADDEAKVSMNQTVRVSNKFRTLLDFHSSSDAAKRARNELTNEEFVQFNHDTNNCQMFAVWCHTGKHVNLKPKLLESLRNSPRKGFYVEIKTLFVQVADYHTKKLFKHPYVWILDAASQTLAASEESIQSDAEAGARRSKLESEVQREYRLMKNVDGVLAANIVVGPKIFGNTQLNKDVYKNVGKTLQYGLWIVVGIDPDNLVTYHFTERKALYGSDQSLVLELDTFKPHHSIENHYYTKLESSQNPTSDHYHGLLFKWHPPSPPNEVGLLKPMPVKDAYQPSITPRKTLSQEESKPLESELYSSWEELLKDSLERPKEGDLIRICVGEIIEEESTPDFKSKSRCTHAICAKGNTPDSLALIHLYQAADGYHRLAKESFPVALSRHLPTIKGAEVLRFYLDNSYKGKIIGNKQGRPRNLKYFSPPQIVARAENEISDQPISCTTSEGEPTDVCGGFGIWCATGRFAFPPIKPNAPPSSSEDDLTDFTTDDGGADDECIIM